MLLIELTINSVVNRISLNDQALTYLWKSEVAEFNSMRVSLEEKSGGYAKPDYGNITFLPRLFTNDWPPPLSCPIEVKYSNTTEAAAVTLFTGTAHLKELDRRGIVYRLYGPDYDFSDATETFSDTLENVIDWFCHADRLNLTTVFTDARATSPNVAYTATNFQCLEELSKLCAFYSHFFTIVGTTLTLVDSLNVGEGSTVTEFDIFPSSYEWPVAYSKIKSKDSTGAEVSSNGSAAYGKEKTVTAYHNTAGNIETALDDLVTLYEMPEATLHFADIATAPAIGDYVNLRDESAEGNIVTTTLIQELNYDFDNDRVVARGIVTSDLWVDSETWTDTETWQG